METLTYLGLVALIIKIGSVIKSVGKDWNTVISQVTVWAVAFFVLLLGHNAEVAKGIVVISGHTLGSLDTGSILLLALVVGSNGSLLYDFKKAIDNTDSASEPSLTKIAKT